MTMPSDDDLDFAADLEAALNGPAPAPIEEEAPANETAEEQEERLYRREGRRFVAKEDKAKEEQEAAPEPAQAQQQPAPKQEKRPTWYKDEYGEWNKLPENLRNAMREQERHAAQGIEKYATAAKAWEPVAQVLQPYEQQLRAQGQTPQQFVGGLVQIYDYLQKDPVQALNWLAQNTLGAGWDIQALADWQAQQGYQAQKIDPVKQELDQLRAQLQQLQEMPIRQRQESAQEQIRQWSQDKPDFEAVRPYMAAIAKQNPNGTLEDWYAAARWAHPEIRERILQEEQDKRVAALKGKRQAGAQTPHGAPMPNAQPRRTRNSKAWDIEADIAEAFDEAGLN